MSSRKHRTLLTGETLVEASGSKSVSCTVGLCRNAERVKGSVIVLVAFNMVDLEEEGKRVEKTFNLTNDISFWRSGLAWGIIIPSLMKSETAA